MRLRLAYFGLAAAAALFGATFVVIKDALDLLPPFAFVGWRFLLGAVVLLVLGRPRGAAIWRDGALAGALLFVGYAAQTAGLASTTASNSGLITGLYVVFTPLLAAAVRKRPPAPVTLGGAVLAVIGLALLTIEDGLTLHTGDALTVLCAIAFAGHIIALARLAPRHPVVGFTAVQLAVTAIAALVVSAIVEGLPVPTPASLPALVTTGVVVSAGAFLLQVNAQRIVEPSRTAMVLALEPVFAASTAAFVLGERLDTRGWLGAVTIMTGIYLVLAFGPDDELVAAEAVTEAH